MSPHACLLLMPTGPSDAEPDPGGGPTLPHVPSVSAAHPVPRPPHPDTGGQAALPPGGEELHVSCELILHIVRTLG